MIQLQAECAVREREREREYLKNYESYDTQILGLDHSYGLLLNSKK